MRALDKLRLRMRTLLQRRSVERELETELRFHLDQQIEENLAGGMPADEARKAAVRAIGGLTQYQEECRDMRRVNLIEHLMQDLQYALRSIRKNPGFTLLVVLIMGLGIGANTAVFSVLNAVPLKPLPYKVAERIVTLSTADKRDHTHTSYVSVPDFRDWHGRSRSFEAMAYYRGGETAVTVSSVADYAQVATVSPEFFHVFKVEPLAGRPFTPEEGTPGSGGAILLSNTYWQSRFGGSHDALGQTLRVYGKALTVVGILPPGFHFPDKTDIWIPTDTIVHDGETRGGLNRQVVALLRKGIGLQQAQSEMESIAASLEQEYRRAMQGAPLPSSNCATTWCATSD